MTLPELFPDEDYRFQLGLHRGDAAEFFRPTSQHESLLTERHHWLQTAPETYSALLPEGIPLLEDAINFAQTTRTVADNFGLCQPLSDFDDAREQCIELGKAWEPDFLLLKADAAGIVRLLAGCVCFPSSWSLAEKIGRPIETIHGVVPGLNPAIGRRIHLFLSKLRPGQASLRANWGLSRSADLNQHPSRKLACLDTHTPAEQVWLRIEQQALLALPGTNGILFGIRLVIHPLTKVKEDLSLALRVARALRTMPSDVAEYKGIAPIRDRIVKWLET